MTAEVSPCTPEEFWGDDETPTTGHRAADVSDPDARRPLEDTPTYLRRLSNELKAAREEIARLTPKPRCRVCGRTDCCAT